MSNKTNFEKVSKFYDTISKDKSSCMNVHNVYLLQSINKDGDITAEAYGINIMTDYGFDIYYGTGSNSNTVSLYIGSGTTTPDPTVTSLTTPITTTGSTSLDGEFKYRPIKYDSTNDTIIGMGDSYYGYFDYKISGLSSNVNITEIGIGTSTTNLFTHSLIYDENGDLSSITKKINEKLYITVYWTIVCPVSLIENAYHDGEYMIINPVVFLKTVQGLCHNIDDIDNYLYQYIGYAYPHNKYCYYDCCGSSGLLPKVTITDHIAKCNASLPDELITGKYALLDDAIFTMGRYSYNGSGMYYITLGHYSKPIRLSIPEEIVSTDVRTDQVNSLFFKSIFKNEYVGAKKSRDGIIPVANFTPTSLSLYNHLTKKWDIEESFDSDETLNYSSSFLFGCSVDVTFNGKDQTAIVCCNNNTTEPITSFSDSGVILYATDKYWDTSTWELITDVKNIDTSLQTKRYYINTNYYSRPGNDAKRYPTLNPVRAEINDLHLSNLPEVYSLPDTAFVSNFDQNRKTLISQSNKWICLDSDVIYLASENKTTYSLPELVALTTSSSKSIWKSFRWNNDVSIVFCEKEFLLNSEYQVKIHIYDIDPDSTVEPIHDSITTNFTTALSMYYKPMMSYTSNNNIGHLVLQHPTSNECIIITTNDPNTEDNTNTQTMISDVKYATAIFMTNKLIYKTISSDENTFVIYNILNSTEELTFTLPSSSGIVTGMVAWKDYVYIQVTDTSNTIGLYVYKISDTSLVYAGAISIECIVFESLDDYDRSVLCERPYVYNDECLILNYGYRPLAYDYDDTGLTWIISDNDYLNPIQTDLRCIMNPQLSYMNNGKQLCMLCAMPKKFISGYNDHYAIYYIEMIDIGLMIDDIGKCKNKLTDISDYTLACLYKPKYYNKSHFALYSDGVIMQTETLTQGEWRPYQTFMQHQLTGTTTNMQAYNNPKNLHFDDPVTIEISNR